MVELRPRWAAGAFLVFLTGVGLGLIHQRRSPSRLKPAIASLLEVVILTLVGLSLGAFWIDWGFYRLGSVGGTWTEFSSSFPIMALAVYVFALGRGAVSRLLSARPLVWLGEISFSIYMLHQPLQNLWMLKGWADDSWRPVSLLVYLVTLLLVSSASWALIEVRLRRGLLALAKRRTRSAVKPTVVP
nr:acyltransferase family protein [Halomonas pellis]